MLKTQEEQTMLRVFYCNSPRRRTVAGRGYRVIDQPFGSCGPQNGAPCNNPWLAGDVEWRAVYMLESADIFVLERISRRDPVCHGRRQQHRATHRIVQIQIEEGSRDCTLGTAEIHDATSIRHDGHRLGSSCDALIFGESSAAAWDA